MRVTVIGTGYVGLVTGCCLSHAGHTVTCVDNDGGKIAQLQRGASPIYEPGLEELIRQGRQQQTLRFTTDLTEAAKDSECIILALPTPPQENGAADLSVVLDVAEQLGRHLPRAYCVIVMKSTVPVGTAERVQQLVAKHATGDFDVVSNPEFLREGHAVEDCLEPERIVLGLSSKRAEAAMRRLYAQHIEDDRPLYITDQRTAELTKYAANAFLATKINFINEIAQLCERLGADVDQLRQAVGADSRIGHAFLYPGIGFGGSCFPKDVRALRHIAETAGYTFQLLAPALDINRQQQRSLVEKLRMHYNGDIHGKTIALWGLAFKPHTDDIRDAPSLQIIDDLLAAGARVAAYDPAAGQNVRQRYMHEKQLTIMGDKYTTLANADALIIATEWPEFVTANLTDIARALRQPVVFDGRNIFQPAAMQAAGITYYSIGRANVRAQ